MSKQSLDSKGFPFPVDPHFARNPLEWEKIVRKFIKEDLPKDVLSRARELEGSIIVAYAKHLQDGKPPKSFIFRDPATGAILCTPAIWGKLEKENSPLQKAAKSMLEASLGACISMWVDQLSAMATKGRYDDLSAFIKEAFGAQASTLELVRDIVMEAFPLKKG